MRNGIRSIQLVVAILFSVSAFAQNSDDALVKRASELSAKGMSNQQIAATLISEGATVNQLSRLYREYGSIMNSTSEDITSQESSNETFRVQQFKDQITTNPVLQTASDNQSNIYGHNIFSEKALNFQPQMNMSTPVDYQLGAGDEIIIDVSGASQLTLKLTISPDGKIVIPKIGPLSLTGYNIDDATKRIRNLMSGYYADCSFTVSLGNVRSIMVNVLGEVRNPGTYTLSSLSSVFNALYLSGGISDIGSVRSIIVNRNGNIVSSIDIYQYLETGDMTGNITLKDNDVVMVPPYGNLVRVSGKVKRPMAYELTIGETLADVIRYAGGFTGDAYTENIRVFRNDEKGPSVHTVSHNDIDRFILKDVDSVHVSSVLQRFIQTVSVSGAVHYPGKYSLTEQISSIKELIEAAGGLDEQVFINRAVLKRMNEDRTTTAMTINLRGIVDGTHPDVLLQNEDVLIIASRKDLLDARTLTISGEVFVPGQYQYSEGETIEDLIIEAGGLTDEASNVNIEVARRIRSNSEKNNPLDLSKLFTFSINENLEIEGDSQFVLEPYDVITIHRNPEYEYQKTVSISGDIMYAGEYTLTNRNMRLSELISRAGGLKQQAYAKGAKLYRISKDNKDFIINMGKTIITADSLVNNTSRDISRVNVEINLEQALTHPGSTDDIILMEGDSISIPQFINTVEISGEVYSPNTVTYKDGKSLNYYIDMAGGYNRNAHRRHVYVVYPNGKISRAKHFNIEPGCHIIVPKKPEKENNSLQNAQIATSISSILATTAAIIISVIKK